MDVLQMIKHCLGYNQTRQAHELEKHLTVTDMHNQMKRQWESLRRKRICDCFFCLDKTTHVAADGCVADD